MRRILLLTAALAAAPGCENTGAENDPLISNELVSRGLQVSSITTLVGAELSLVASAPPQGFTTCPTVTQDGDEWVFDYGVDGCVPDSGLTTDTMVGTIAVTVAGGSGAFLGSITEFGVGDSLLSAQVSGSTSTAGDLITADVDLGVATWQRGQVSFTFEAFLEMEGDADQVSLFIDDGVLLGSDEVALFVEADGASAPRASLAGCFVPSGGEMELLRELGRANLDFTEETHTSGSVSASHNDRDPASVSPCGG
ncbi:MAG: hypothetical protein KDA24_23615 [Deltaproteobacteria bacterium]|nr:hypothetical protein [Deltaproteobacteria bacterium]